MCVSLLTAVRLTVVKRTRVTWVKVDGGGWGKDGFFWSQANDPGGKVVKQGVMCGNKKVGVRTHKERHRGDTFKETPSWELH